jgi:hypothetical protein
VILNFVKREKERKKMESTKADEVAEIKTATVRNNFHISPAFK